MLQPPSPGSFVWFSLICYRRGDSTAAVVRLDTVADESRKMAYSVTRSPGRLCSRDGKLCCYGRLEYDFFAFVPCFLLSLFSSLSRYVCLVRVPSFVQQSSVSLSKYVLRVLSACVICILPHLGIALFLFV